VKKNAVVAALPKPSRAQAVLQRAISSEERYDANIDRILRAAAVVFAEKSFGLASIRDIAARARISFPRIYYYLRNKEQLLFLISERAFTQLMNGAEKAIATTPDADARLRLLINGHLEYHMANIAEMKVLVREADSLSGRYAAKVKRLKRDYSRLFRRTIEDLASARGKTLDRESSRILTSLLFGAMNWFYTWYDPARDFSQRERIMEEVFRMISAAISSR